MRVNLCWGEGVASHSYGRIVVCRGGSVGWQACGTKPSDVDRMSGDAEKVMIAMKRH